jgi:hypothetical protein
VSEEPTTTPPSEEEESSANQQAEEEQATEESEEQQAEEDEQRSVSSSMVAEVGYDREAEEVHVVFNNGHEEGYSCTPETWTELLAASSVGKFMHENFL